MTRFRILLGVALLATGLFFAGQVQAKHPDTTDAANAFGLHGVAGVVIGERGSDDSLRARMRVQGNADVGRTVTMMLAGEKDDGAKIVIEANGPLERFRHKRGRGRGRIISGWQGPVMAIVTMGDRELKVAGRIVLTSKTTRHHHRHGDARRRFHRHGQPRLVGKFVPVKPDAEAETDNGPPVRVWARFTGNRPHDHRRPDRPKPDNPEGEEADQNGRGGR